MRFVEIASFFICFVNFYLKALNHQYINGKIN